MQGPSGRLGSHLSGTSMRASRKWIPSLAAMNELRFAGARSRHSAGDQIHIERVATFSPQGFFSGIGRSRTQASHAAASQASQRRSRETRCS